MLTRSHLFLLVALFGAATAANIVKRDGGGHGHGGGHSGGGSAHGGASAGGSGYAAPAQSYGAPEASYGAPAPSYGYQEPSYNSGGYGGATSYYEEDDKLGFPIAALLIPLLILAGLALLFPTVTLVTGRKKRDVGEDVDPMTDMLERVNDIYMAVVESEECMERIACEVGGLAGDFNLKENTLAKVAEPFVPSKYKQFYKQFTNGKDCQKIKCGTFNF